MYFELFALLLKELRARRNVSIFEEAVAQQVPSQSLNYSKIIFKKHRRNSATGSCIHG